MLNPNQQIWLAFQNVENPRGLSWIRHGAHCLSLFRRQSDGVDYIKIRSHTHSGGLYEFWRWFYVQLWHRKAWFYAAWEATFRRLLGSCTPKRIAIQTVSNYSRRICFMVDVVSGRMVGLEKWVTGRLWSVGYSFSQSSLMTTILYINWCPKTCYKLCLLLDQAHPLKNNATDWMISYIINDTSTII